MTGRWYLPVSRGELHPLTFILYDLATLGSDFFFKAIYSCSVQLTEHLYTSTSQSCSPSGPVHSHSVPLSICCRCAPLLDLSQLPQGLCTVIVCPGPQYLANAMSLRHLLRCPHQHREAFMWPLCLNPLLLLPCLCFVIATAFITI